MLIKPRDREQSSCSMDILIKPPQSPKKELVMQYLQLITSLLSSLNSVTHNSFFSFLHQIPILSKDGVLKTNLTSQKKATLSMSSTDKQKRKLLAKLPSHPNSLERTPESNWWTLILGMLSSLPRRSWEDYSSQRSLLWITRKDLVLMSLVPTWPLSSTCSISQSISLLDSMLREILNGERNLRLPRDIKKLPWPLK